MSEDFKKYNSGSSSIISTYEHKFNQPFLDDEVFTDLQGLYNLKSAHFGKVVAIVSPAPRESCGVYVLIQMPSPNTTLHNNIAYAQKCLFDENCGEKDETPNISESTFGRSSFVGWKKIDDGGSSLQIEDKNGESITVDKISSGDVYIEKDEESNEYKLVLNEELQLAIFGGDSTGSGDIIEIPTAYTIDGVTLSTNKDGESGTGDDNEIYVATTDGGTWDEK